MLNCRHALLSPQAEEFRSRLLAIGLLNHYVWHAASLREVLALLHMIADELRVGLFILTATGDGKFGLTFNLDRLLLYNLLGWFGGDEFFAEVFALGFLLPLLLLPLLVLEVLDHEAAPRPEARPVEHLRQE